MTTERSKQFQVLKKITDQSNEWNRFSKKDKVKGAYGFLIHCQSNLRSKEEKSEMGRKGGIAKAEKLRLQKALINSAREGSISK